MQRRNFVVGLCVAGVAALTTTFAGAAAAAYPEQPIKLIVPFAPGGTTDIVGRLLAERLGNELNQVIVVENRAGAGGSIGTATVAQAKPDGYTLGIATVSTHGINPVVYKNLPYDAGKDFTPITNIAAVPNVMVLNPQKVSARNMAEFVEQAKADPGKFAYASAGNGSVSHMMGELFKMASGTDLLHVPYRGVGPALTDTLAGQVDILFDNLPSSIPHIKEGKLVALAVASPERSAAVPDVPTFAEVGLEPVNDPSWFGLIAPAGLPADIRDALNKAAVKALSGDEIKERLAQLGATPVADSPEEFQQTIQKTLERNAKIAQEANISLD
ncbi:MAG TPA: tripartite tricarboxylate transporter substrate binding protein BugE [Burkholderiaceae bacterium]|nr:tripartite tricarboxylate transporter substrate binding protein BugE [Burkholderiaceae bacterium]